MLWLQPLAFSLNKFNLLYLEIFSCKFGKCQCYWHFGMIKTTVYQLHPVCIHWCNIMAEGFRFIYLVFRFSKAENLSAKHMG